MKVGVPPSENTLHPVGTSMTSLVAVVGHWLTSAMLSAAPELDSPPSAHRPTLCMEIRLTACSFDMDRPKSVRNARREAQPERRFGARIRRQSSGARSSICAGAVPAGWSPKIATISAGQCPRRPRGIVPAGCSPTRCFGRAAHPLCGVRPRDDGGPGNVRLATAVSVGRATTGGRVIHRLWL